jgi:hypothetical protein
MMNRPFLSLAFCWLILSNGPALGQSPDGAPEPPATRLTIYCVDDLPVYRIGPNGTPVFDPAPLVMYLKQKVDAKSWGRDGHGIVVNRPSKSLFVKQTGPNHDAIQSILQRVGLFCRPISEASIQETIVLAKKTNLL